MTEQNEDVSVPDSRDSGFGRVPDRLSHERTDERERSIRLEERSRIAVELHDRVIQPLLGAGLRTQAMADHADDRGVRDQLTELTALLESAIREIRQAVFALPNDAAGWERGRPLRTRVSGLIDEMTELLPSAPSITFSGPLDVSLSDDLADDFLAVLREALTNIARHAHASEVLISVTVDAERAALLVLDDGIGIGKPERRGGLASMEHRAARWHGALSFGPRPGGGTMLEWSARLPGAVATGAGP
ncbi:sensor histidine kinase [Ruicaihuangia caeni]|uniref:Histidine kinase n=1 Tax=Ruicaihuangia caeni TaxID=3042517 RepID=A0AAW6T7N1_9MICO|nr:histidine kinase [Klugiella sp. YN-L-19]MDI2097647.1 histidine kinase [Klugiella sp. YN-L-19]